GLGGLGHMAVKIAKAMGAEVSVFSTSPSKEADAKTLGADGFIVSKDHDAMAAAAGSFNLIIDTVSANHDINPYINALGLNGVLVVVGMPETPATVHQASLILGNKAIAGSLIGGIPETQEMLDFCAKHGIKSDIELIKPDYIDQAYERTIKADVRYRFVIDMKNA
ncbi:MAG: zinc-binding dehydrogenase, partial [Pyrinomonadaceae bacterium]|nr:zinc-binding dehydrogenase [Pyrinomonadaceae bacterium]